MLGSPLTQQWRESSSVACRPIADVYQPRHTPRINVKSYVFLPFAFFFVAFYPARLMERITEEVSGRGTLGHVPALRVRPSMAPF